MNPLATAAGAAGSIAELAPGLRIRKTLVLERLLGAGGMATVWIADDLARGRKVAVKVIGAEYADNAEAVERFTSEARVMARIKSPFVPEVHDRGALADGTPFIVMELLEGIDLDGYLRAHGRLSVAQTATVVSQVARALEAAHRIGIVHRDVKAENIFIQGRGDQVSAKLFDFGIAKIPFDPRRTQLGTLIGTPGYMSPEQLSSSKDVDARADLWSLGVVAYLALTGDLPFEGETFGAVCVAVHQARYKAPTQAVPGLPEEIDAWIAKALNPKLEERFQTPMEMVASLERVSRRDTPPVHALELLLESDEASAARTSHASVVAVSRTARFSRESRTGLFVACAAAAAAMAIYSTSAAHANAWIPARLSGSWTALVAAGRPALATGRATVEPASPAVGPTSASAAPTEPPPPAAAPIAPLNASVTAGPSPAAPFLSRPPAAVHAPRVLARPPTAATSTRGAVHPDAGVLADPGVPDSDNPYADTPIQPALSPATDAGTDAAPLDGVAVKPAQPILSE